MGKWGLFSVSIVPALVAGILSAFMIMVLVQHSPLEPTMLLILVCLTLAVSAFVTVLPFGVLIFYPKGELAAAGAGATTAGEGVSDAAIGGSSAEVDEQAADDVVDDEELLVDEDEFGAEEDFGGDLEVEEADAGDDVFLEGDADEFEDFDIEEFDDDQK